MYFLMWSRDGFSLPEFYCGEFGCRSYWSTSDRNLKLYSNYKSVISIRHRLARRYGVSLHDISICFRAI